MARITAKFEDIEIPGALTASDEIAESITAQIGDCDIVAQFKGKGSWAKKRTDSENWISAYAEMTLFVTRDIEFNPPAVVPDEKGIPDYGPYTEYMEQVAKAYFDAAHTFLTRLFAFGRFALHQHIFPAIQRWHRCLPDPDFFDGDGKPVGKYLRRSFTAHAEPGMGHRSPGTCALDSKTLGDLQTALETDPAVELWQEYLADAHDSCFKSHIKRAIIELAIAAEIRTKTAFFGAESRGQLVFDCLEDQNKVKVRVLELVDGIALSVLGASFKADHESDYTNIDYLFRARNKVAHRGVSIFRNAQGKPVEVTSTMICDWWLSVLQLAKWLDEKCR